MTVENVPDEALFAALMTRPLAKNMSLRRM